MTLSIRGHHLLCMMGFRGLGYSPAFVENMRLVVAAFFGAPGSEVAIAAGCDAICTACPHQRGGVCASGNGSEEAVAAKDARVLQELGMSAGDRAHSLELARRVAERIEPARLAEVCAGCSWLPLGYCEAGLAEFRRKFSAAPAAPGESPVQP